MTDLVSLTERLGGAARLRVGLKPALAAPKIEALLRAMPEDERASYVQRVLSEGADGETFQAFVEALLVHETYFFRHPDQLRLLADELLPRLVQARVDAGEAGISAWCAGCASGEEVYTVALLLEAARTRGGPRETSFGASVVGTDVSEHALREARRAKYALLPGLNSFRDVPEYARHHFGRIFARAGDEGWSPSDELRRLTRFVRHNLVTDPAPPGGPFDLVLCRNTLIYFDEDGARRALRTLEESLRPGGLLFLGPAEMPREGSHLSMRCTDQAVYWSRAR